MHLKKSDMKKKKKMHYLHSYFTNLPKLIGQFYLVLNQISRSLFSDLLCLIILLTVFASSQTFLYNVCFLQLTVSVFQGKMKDG